VLVVELGFRATASQTLAINPFQNLIEMKRLSQGERKKQFRRRSFSFCRLLNVSPCEARQPDSRSPPSSDVTATATVN
jgi:hypothetical protein